MKNSVRFLFPIVFVLLLSFKTEAQLSAQEMALIEGLPMDISAALMETKTNPSAESDTMLNNVVQQNRINQRRSQIYFEKYKTTVDLTPFNLGVRKAYDNFGYNYFSGVPYSFFFNEDVSLPPDYEIQIGDTFEFQVTGADAQFNGRVIKLRVTQDGNLNIPYLGATRVLGLKFSDLKDVVSEEFSFRFPGSSPYLTILNTALISVVLTGEVMAPGTYSIRNLTRVTNLLNVAGGLNTNASLREIIIKRSDGTEIKLDLYKILLGNSTLLDDIALRNGDSVHVPIVKNRIAILGGVKREAVYEALESDSITDLIRYAGGKNYLSSETATYIFSNKVSEIDLKNPKNLNIQNNSVLFINDNLEYSYDTFEIQGLSSQSRVFSIKSGTKLSEFLKPEELNASIYKGLAVLARFDKRFNTTNYYPVNILDNNFFKNLEIEKGDKLIFFTKDDINFLSSTLLIKSLSGEVFSKYTNPFGDANKVGEDIDRSAPTLETLSEDEDSTSESIADSVNPNTCRSLIDLQNMQNQYSAAWVLANFKDDMVREDEDRCRETFDNNIGLITFLLNNSVFVSGEVYEQGLFPISKEFRADDVISMARPLDIASISKVEVINKSGDLMDFRNDATLNSYDTLTVNNEFPDQELGYVELRGAFNSPGIYKIRRNETLLTLIERAGGYKTNAYPRAGILTRESIKVRERLGLERAKQDLRDGLASAITSGAIKTADPESINQIIEFATQLDSIEAVGRLVAEFEISSLKMNPELNIRVESGDVIHMPTRNNTVTISGHVLNPITVPYVADHSVEKYLAMSGGLRNGANGSNIYYILPNGVAVRNNEGILNLFSGDNIDPGSNIIVPRKSRVLDGLSLVETLAPTVASLSISLASIASINNN